MNLPERHLHLAGAAAKSQYITGYGRVERLFESDIFQRLHIAGHTFHRQAGGRGFFPCHADHAAAFINTGTAATEFRQPDQMGSGTAANIQNMNRRTPAQ